MGFFLIILIWIMCLHLHKSELQFGVIFVMNIAADL